MTTRTTKHDLDIMLERLEHTFPGEGWLIQRAYGKPRLLRKDGAVDVSPRLPAGQLEEWISAFLQGAWFLEEKTR